MNRNPVTLLKLPSRLPISRKSLKNFPDQAGDFLDARLSSKDVEHRISNDEYSCFSKVQSNGFSANQVGVNRPVEDRWSAFRLGKSCFLEEHYDPQHPLVKSLEDFNGGHIFSVVDGHGGHTCAHAINMLHADYLATAISPRSFLENCLDYLHIENRPMKTMELVEQCWIREESKVNIDSTSPWGPAGPWGSLDSIVAKQHSQSLAKYIEESLSTFDAQEELSLFLEDNNDLYDKEGCLVATGREMTNPGDVHRVDRFVSQIRNSLLRLDSDITMAAIPNTDCKLLNKSLLRIVLSGCVLSSVYIPASLDEVYGIQIGDCGIVMGEYQGNGNLQEPENGLDVTDFTGEFLLPFHNAQNDQEATRLKAEHPIHEAEFLIREDRLLGELMPFRAFGDIRYKCSPDTLKQIARLLDMPPNYPVIPKYYKSPPYLIAKPQIIRKRLDTACHPFLILGTDGLWDVLNAQEAVSVVAQHFIDYKGKPWLAAEGDTAASRLIRTAFGGDSMDPGRISMILSVPANIARYYRDDISVIVVYPKI